MKWINYEKNFIIAAKESDYSEEYINRNLEIAHKLFHKKLPIIFNQEHFSFLVGIDLQYLLKASNSQSNFYRYFKIPKKSKGLRDIAEPLPNLKLAQKWILEEILYSCPTSNYAKAYKKGVSLKENAKFHRGQKKVLSLDINNFFGSFKYSDVYSFFISLGYSKDVSVLLTNLCTLKGSLPQGAPTSPALFNLLFTNIDKRISIYTNNKRIRYTRYADDLTFSGDYEVGELISFVKNIFASKGFTLNTSKTRVRLPHQRQEVTGIIVNEKLQAPKELRRDLRKNIYFIKKFGLDSHLSIKDKEKKTYLKYLLGVANYIHSINPKDDTASNNLIYLKELWAENFN